MLETIIIYGLYLALPSILLYRSLGPKKTGLIFTGIIALHQTASTNIDQITLPVVTESDTTTILAKNTRDESNKNKKKIIN